MGSSTWDRPPAGPAPQTFGLPLAPQAQATSTSPPIPAPPLSSFFLSSHARPQPSLDLVARMFEANRDLFGKHRSDGPRPMKGGGAWEGLMTLLALRLAPIS